MATYVKGGMVANATNYKLLEKIAEEDYVLLAENNLINFDLSRINFEVGEHTLVVKATAEGYEDSEYSNEVVYVVST